MKNPELPLPQPGRPTMNLLETTWGPGGLPVQQYTWWGRRRRYRPFFGRRAWNWRPRVDGLFLSVYVMDKDGRRYEWWGPTSRRLDAS